MRIRFILPALLLITNLISAQWIQTNGPVGGVINCLASNGTNLFAGSYGGVFLSTNNGTNWTAVNNGFTADGVSALAVSDINLFAGINGGSVYLSTNNGTSWTAVNNAWPLNTHIGLLLSSARIY